MGYTKNPNEHYRRTPRGKWTLYNLSNDPGEDKDVANEHPEIVQRMAVAYEAWWAKVRPSLINEKK